MIPFFFLLVGIKQEAEEAKKKEAEEKAAAEKAGEKKVR